MSKKLQFPDPNVEQEFEAPNGKTYVWNGFGWEIECGGTDVSGFVTKKEFEADQDRQDQEYEDKFVKVSGGDTMEGQLIISGPRKAGDDVDNPDLVSSLKVLSIDNAQNSSLQLRHSGNAKVYVGDTDVSIASDIKFNRAAGSVVKSNVQDLLNIGQQEIAYLGRSIEDEDLITKKYVDDAKDSLYQDIIELEEEINAIAPSLEYGTWQFGIPANANRPPSTGTFYLLDNGVYTDEYEKVTAIAIHNDEYVDPDGSDLVDNHTWADADVGELIQLFDAADPDFFLGKITAKNVDDIGQCVYFTVDRIQSSGVPNDNADPDTGKFLTRVNIFKEPSGGTASDFVLKSGDTMSGDLAIDKSAGTNTEAALTLTGNRPNTNNSAATIAFENSQSTKPGYLTYRAYGSTSWFQFNQDVDLNNHGLHSVAQIRMQPGGYIGSAANPRLTFNNATSGQDGEGLLAVPRPSENRRGFTIRGNDADGNEQDMLYTFTNVFGTPDAVNYVGKMDSDTNLVNKAYVDAATTGVILFGDVCKWRQGALEESTIERYQFFGIEMKGNSSTQIGYGNVLYLNKLITAEGTLEPLENYTPTSGSTLEVWSGNELYFKSLLNPTTYKVSNRSPDEIVCDFTSEYAIVAKGGTNWSQSTSYRVILTGMKRNG